MQIAKKHSPKFCHIAVRFGVLPLHGRFISSFLTSHHSWVKTPQAMEEPTDSRSFWAIYESHWSQGCMGEVPSLETNIWWLIIIDVYSAQVLLTTTQVLMILMAQIPALVSCLVSLGEVELIPWHSSGIAHKTPNDPMTRHSWAAWCRTCHTILRCVASHEPEAPPCLGWVARHIPPWQPRSDHERSKCSKALQHVKSLG